MASRKGDEQGEVAVVSAMRMTMTQGSFTALLELWQDCTWTETIHVETSNENGEAFAGVNSNGYNKTRVLKYCIENHMGNDCN